MQFTSTNRTSPPVSFMEAMRAGLAPDGGLYMPVEIPVMPDVFDTHSEPNEFQELAFRMAKPYLSDELSDREIQSVVSDAFNFTIQVQAVDEHHFILELFHGPTLAFKDFGARFMARLFSEKVLKDQREVTILVATSGDTGSAVAHGFYNVPGVRVCLLYPKGKVSKLQEQQMTTLGENITTLEVEGVFDDCQRLVKQAFTDSELNSVMQLSSANSINIARLLPQSFYYAYAHCELRRKGLKNPAFSVPSGNFGNLTGGLLAMKMGMETDLFLAATNENDIVPAYLSGAAYQPRHSVPTISNAMDVGNPSNFVRIQALFNGADSEIRSLLKGYSYSDDQTRETIRQLYHNRGYVACPHTAIGYRAALEDQSKGNSTRPYVTLATAHPVKFKDVIEPEINSEIPVPSRLQKWLSREKKSHSIGKEYETFKDFLFDL